MLVRSLSGIVLVLFISGAIGGTTQAGSGAKPTEQPKATASIKSKQPAVGEGCKSTLKTLVENGLAWGKSCSIGANQWRVWCLNGSLYDEAHPCPKGEANVPSAEGTGCKTPLMALVENNVLWGKGCSIATNQWRFWCSNGRVYDEAHAGSTSPGALGKLCDPALEAQEAEAKQLQGSPVADASTPSPDQNAVGQCVEQIFSRNPQCQLSLTLREVRQVDRRVQNNTAELIAEVDFVSTQEFEVRSDVATNCTGTWWSEDPRLTRHQVGFAETKYLVRTGQILSIRKIFAFRKNETGWLCQTHTMKPIEDATWSGQ